MFEVGLTLGITQLNNELQILKTLNKVTVFITAAFYKSKYHELLDIHELSPR